MSLKAKMPASVIEDLLGKVKQRSRAYRIDAQRRVRAEDDYLKKRARSAYRQKKLAGIDKRLRETIGPHFDNDGETSVSTSKYKRVQWEILPAGKHPFSAIEAHFACLKAKGFPKEIDLDRIRTIQRFKPDEVYFGTVQFEGYLVFYFKKKRIAILDCSIWGNAIYVVRGDWRKISKLTKAEVIHNYPKTVRIIHSGDWKQRLSGVLRS